MATSGTCEWEQNFLSHATRQLMRAAGNELHTSEMTAWRTALRVSFPLPPPGDLPISCANKTSSFTWGSHRNNIRSHENSVSAPFDRQDAAARKLAAFGQNTLLPSSFQKWTQWQESKSLLVYSPVLGVLFSLLCVCMCSAIASLAVDDASWCQVQEVARKQFPKSILSSIKCSIYDT